MEIELKLVLDPKFKAALMRHRRGGPARCRKTVEAIQANRHAALAVHAF